MEVSAITVIATLAGADRQLPQNAAGKIGDKR
jgi:hypothetical protein